MERSNETIDKDNKLWSTPLTRPPTKAHQHLEASNPESNACCVSGHLSRSRAWSNTQFRCQAGLVRLGLQPLL